MALLHAISYVAGAAAFLFVLLSLASGLLYVAEVIEEHSGVAKVVGQRLIYVVACLLVVLHFTDELPWHVTGLCVFAHVVYHQNFSRTWPAISLISPAFLLSCVLVVATHFVAFSHFSERAQSPRRYRPGSKTNNHWGGYNPPGSQKDTNFLDVATFFGVCIWLVPFYLFLSLSANDNVLPSAGDLPSTPSAAPSTPNASFHSRKQSSIMKTALSSALALFLRPRTASKQNEGILSSPTASRGSRPSSPSLYPSQVWTSGTSSPPRSPGMVYGSSTGGSPVNNGFVRPLPPRRATESVLPPAGERREPYPVGIIRGPQARRPSVEPSRAAREREATPPSSQPPLFQSPSTSPLHWETQVVSPVSGSVGTPDGMVKRKVG